MKKKHKKVTDFPYKYHGISKRKRALLTDEFLKTFKSEIESIFDSSHFSYETKLATLYTSIGNTYGFNVALQKACIKHNIVKAIYEYGESLEWYDSDNFYSDLAELMLNRGVISKGDHTTNEIPKGLENNVKRYKLVKRYKDYSVIKYDWCLNADVRGLEKLTPLVDSELVWL